MTDTPKLCTVEDCGRSHFGRGWCKRHYNRWYRNGGNLSVPQSPQTRDVNSDPRNMSSEARAEFGVIVTFENADGKRLTLHREGQVKNAIRRACADALSLDETFKVRAISTPSSIFTDLQGGRAHLDRKGGSVNLGHVEASMLGRLKLAHLTHPSLLA